MTTEIAKNRLPELDQDSYRFVGRYVASWNGKPVDRDVSIECSEDGGSWWLCDEITDTYITHDSDETWTGPFSSKADAMNAAEKLRRDGLQEGNEDSFDVSERLQRERAKHIAQVSQTLDVLVGRNRP